jgi:hypothetical protein
MPKPKTKEIIKNMKKIFLVPDTHTHKRHRIKFMNGKPQIKIEDYEGSKN